MNYEDLEKFKISTYDSLVVPKQIYYIPEFINQDEEEYLINKVNDSSKIKWVYLSNRRLQNWGGFVHPKGLIQEDLPTWLSIYCAKIAKLKIFESNSPNHVLINEYLPGQGIMPHEDGPAFYPTVATINLGSHTVLNFYPKAENKNNSFLTPDFLQHHPSHLNLNDKLSFSLLLQPRSVLILQKDAYKSYLHGISEVQQDCVSSSIANLVFCPGVKLGSVLTRTTRISLTLRYIPKSIKASFLLQK